MLFHVSTKAHDAVFLDDKRVREAAARLAVTEADIRKRIQRGSLDKEMEEDERGISS